MPTRTKVEGWFTITDSTYLLFREHGFAGNADDYYDQQYY